METSTVALSRAALLQQGKVDRVRAIGTFPDAVHREVIWYTLCMENATFRAKRLPLVIAAVVISAAGVMFGFKLLRDVPVANRPTLSPSSTGKTEHVADSSKCGECHVQQYQSYLQSGHARTFWSTRDFPFRDRFDQLEFDDHERNTTFHYRTTESGLDVVVPGLFDGDRFPLQFAFGSGDNGITLVTLTPDGTGIPVGIEHRVSWISGMGGAVLTPGQSGLAVEHDIEYFGRVIRGATLERCFECHTTSCKIREDKLIDLIPNVGCEGCHSSSASHAAAMGNDPESTIVGFKERPWRTAEQIQICAECHRGVNNVEASQIRRDNPKIVRYQPVGLVQSKCYEKSKRLLCSTCHDPHQHAAKRTTREYELQCLACHSTSPQATQCSVSSNTGCVACHMPRVEIHPSVSFHDHWIRIRDNVDPPVVEDEK